MIEELITTRNLILEEIRGMFEHTPVSPNFSEWATTLRKDNTDVEKFLKSIYWTHFYEQLWLNFEALEQSDEDKDFRRKAIVDALKDHPNISNDIRDSMLALDRNDDLESTEREKCEHPLGCIGCKNLRENEFLSQHPFLKKFTQIQSDHLWPKSRTPHHHISADVPNEGLDLCGFHNLNKMNCMDFHVFFMANGL